MLNIQSSSAFAIQEMESTLVEMSIDKIDEDILSYGDVPIIFNTDTLVKDIGANISTGSMEIVLNYNIRVIS
jgi:hypothetical protein